MSTSTVTETEVMSCTKGTSDKRKPNWSGDENLLLVQLIEEHKSVLRGKFSQKVSVSTKKSAWQAIATQLSVAFPHVVRTPDECEKKWFNILSKSRQQIASYNRQITGTGGGPNTAKLSAVAQTVHDILGETNVSISGLEEGIDTSFLQVIDMTSSLDKESLFAAMPPVQTAQPTYSIQTQDFQPVQNPPLPCLDQDRNHQARKRQLELDVLEAQLQYYTLKIKKIKNEL